MAALSSNEVFESAKRAAKSSSVVGHVTGYSDGCALLSAYAHAIFTQEKPNILILDSALKPIPIAELAHAVRAIETGMGVKRTPILVIGQTNEDNSVNEACRTLGNARFIPQPATASPADLGPRIVGLVEKLLIRH